MIITDAFVYIHLPKTGGSFVNAALLQAHGIRWNAWHHVVLTFSGRLIHRGALGYLCMRDKHGSCHRIPPKDRQKPIISCMRNPLDYYVSDYEFGWWKRREWQKYYQQIPQFRQKYPNFPALSLPDYLRLMAEAFNPTGQQDFDDPEQLGYFSASFLKMFARNSVEIFADPELNRMQANQLQEKLFPVRFMTTQGLNQQLYALLKDFAYPEANIRFILEKERVHPLGKGRSVAQHWERYYQAEWIELIRQKDRLLFELFPEFDPKLCT